LVQGEAQVRRAREREVAMLSTYHAAGMEEGLHP
jgi:hypothetical protein